MGAGTRALGGENTPHLCLLGFQKDTPVQSELSLTLFADFVSYLDDKDKVEAVLFRRLCHNS